MRGRRISFDGVPFSRRIRPDIEVSYAAGNLLAYDTDGGWLTIAEPGPICQHGYDSHIVDCGLCRVAVAALRAENPGAAVFQAPGGGWLVVPREAMVDPADLRFADELTAHLSKQLLPPRP